MFHPGLQSLGDKIWAFVRKKKHGDWSTTLSSGVHEASQSTLTHALTTCVSKYPCEVVLLHTCIPITGIWQLTDLLVFLHREPLPTIFSMLHPLDEIAPIVCKPGGNMCKYFPLYAPLCLNQMFHFLKTLSCVIFRSLWGFVCAVCLWCLHDHRVQLLSALSGRFLWHCPGCTFCLGPTQGHAWCERSHTDKCKPTALLSLKVPFYLSRSVLQCCGARLIQLEHHYVWWRQDFCPLTSVICPTWTLLVVVGHMALVLELDQGLWYNVYYSKYFDKKDSGPFWSNKDNLFYFLDAFTYSKTSYWNYCKRQLIHYFC